MNVIVSSVLLAKDRKVLLVRETKKEAHGKWGLPGGQLEPKETLEACAIREFREETGISVSLQKLIAITHKPITSHGNTVVRFIYSGERVGESIEAELEHEYIDEKKFRELVHAELIRGQDVVWVLDHFYKDTIEPTVLVQTFV